MTQTTHGHHVPGTTRMDEIRSVPSLFCGGVGFCNRCSKEADRIQDKIEMANGSR
jgi:hypothetical protein